jgi:hypothetical protein
LFFNPKQARVFNDEVATWPGFFTSSWIFQKGLYLIIDNISKFLSVENCLSLIDERYQRLKDEAAVAREFEGAIVMTRYGTQRSYRVSKIRWDMSPSKYFFDQGDSSKKTSMLEYFSK